MTIVELVKLGFGGLAAAFALLSYRLMAQEGRKDKPNTKVYTAISQFAKYTLLLALVVILGSIVDATRDFVLKNLEERIAEQRRENLRVSKYATDCRQTLQGLQGAEGAPRDPVALSQANQLAYTTCRSILSDLGKISREDKLNERGDRASGK